MTQGDTWWHIPGHTAASRLAWLSWLGMAVRDAPEFFMPYK